MVQHFALRMQMYYYTNKLTAFCKTEAETFLCSFRCKVYIQLYRIWSAVIVSTLYSGKKNPLSLSTDARKGRSLGIILDQGEMFTKPTQSERVRYEVTKTNGANYI